MKKFQVPKKKTIHNALLILGIIFVAFNLRPAITSVGPLIGLIREDLGISNGVAGFITTLPLLSFAFLSILAPKLGQLLGNERTIFFGLIALFIGIIIRSTGLAFTLFLGTALVGIGVAIGNVLLPSILKLNFPTRVGIMTSVYTTSMNTFAGLGSGISFPLAQGLELGWQKALGTWGVLALIAIIIWVPQLQHKQKPSTTVNFIPSSKSIWSSPLAWQVTIFMGLQSFLFYSTVAWFPEILESNGMDLSLAGWMLSLMQLVGLPTTFFAPMLASRFRNQKGIVIIVGLFYFIGITGFLLNINPSLIIVSIILIGMAQGASISLALTLIGMRSTNAQQAANLSGMAQSIGYLLAAIGPILIGFLFDQTHSWTVPLVVLSLVSVVMIVAGLGAGRNQYVISPTEKDTRIPQ